MTALPKKIGKYHIQSLLGSGAMGVVYQGFDPDIERKVAIKVLHGHLMESEQGKSMQDRFRREAQAAARCSHPRIVAVYELGHETGRDFIVMEFVQGEELKYFLNSGHAFSLQESLHIMSMMLEGLKLAHHYNVIHRDIKPANIILLDTGEIKIADFGVAKIDTSDLTVAGNVIGTPSYMCPEGLNGQEVDHRADIYSSGMVLFEMLTGEKPTPKELYNQPVSAFIEKVFQRERASSLPDSMRSVLKKALADEKEDRYQSTGDFLIAIRNEEAEISMTESASETLAETVIRQRPLAEPVEQLDLDEKLLAKLEKGLTSYIGPVAKLLLKKCTTTEQTPQSLIEELAGHIENFNEREEFLRQARRCINDDACNSMQRPVENSSRKPAVSENLSAEQIEEITRALAYYVGPMAQRIVRQASLCSYSLDELHHTLATNIPSNDEKAAFLKKVSA